MDTSPERKAQNVYISTLSSALTDYIIKKVKIEPQKSYYLANIDIGGFITAFDDVMNAIRSDEAEKEETEYTHRKFEGLPIDRVANEAWARVAPAFNKTLPTMWKERIRSRSMKIEDMEKTTSSLYTQLAPIDMDGVDKTQLQDELKTIVAAYEAMRQVRETRKGFFGFFWRLFNREQNTKEVNYLNRLKNQISMLEQKEYDVDVVTNALNEKNILSREVPSATNAKEVQPDVAKTVNENQKKENISVNEDIKVNDNIKEIAEDNVVSRLEPIINDREYIEEFSEKLFAAVPNGKELVQGKEKEFVTLFSATLKLLIQNYNGKYDKMQANKQDPEPLVKSMLDLVFADASTSFSNIIGYKTTEEKLLAAQIMSDMIMKEFTPVRFQPEKYGKYASGYVLNNVEEFRDIAKENKKDIAAAKAKFNHEVPEQSLASENPNYLNNIEFDPGESYSHDEFYDDNESEVKHEEVEEERANVGVAFDDESFERLREYFASNGGGVIYRPLEPKPEIKKVTEEANAIYEDTIKKEQFIKDLANRLPENSVSMDDKLFIIGNELHGIYLNIKNENENYDFFRSDDSYADMVDDCLPTMVSGVFQVSTFLAGKLGYTNNRDKLVVAQLITDMAMREYSPVRFIKGLEEYAQAYALMHSKDDNFKERFADVKPKDIREAANEYGNILKGLPMKPIIEDKEEEKVNYMRFPNGKQSVEQSEEIDDEDYSDDEEYIDEEEQKKFADQLKADIEGKSVETKSVQVESKENLVKKNVIE
jgi:hypothetical protein